MFLIEASVHILAVRAYILFVRGLFNNGCVIKRCILWERCSKPFEHCMRAHVTPQRSPVDEGREGTQDA